MDKRFILISLSLLGFLAIVAFLFFSQSPKRISPLETSKTPQPTQTPSFKLEIISDSVFVSQNSSEWVEIKSSQNIDKGTWVKPNEKGRAQVTHENKTVTRIDSNSEIKIDEFSLAPFNLVVFLKSGKIWSRVVNLLGGDSYETQSSNLVASIRGTSYGHEILEGNKDKLIVTQNKVLGKCLNESGESPISENLKGTFDCVAKKPVLVEKVSNKDLKEEWVLFNRIKDEELDKEPSPKTPRPILKTPSPSPIISKTPLPTEKPTSTPTPAPTKFLEPSPSPPATPAPTKKDQSAEPINDRLF